MKRLILLLVAVTSLISILVCTIFSANIDDGFSAVLFYPAIYLVSFILIYASGRDREGVGRVTIGIYQALQWLRMVLLPALGAACGYFTESAEFVTHSAAVTASWLVLWECVLTSILICFILRFSKKKAPLTRQPEYELAGNRSIYFLFVLAAIVVYFLRGRGSYTLLSLDVNSVRVSQTESGNNLIVSSIIGYGLSFIVILSVYFAYLRYRRTKKKQYIWIALLIGILRILIIPAGSESRLGIVYSMGALLLLLPLLFPQEKKWIIRGVVIAAAVVIGLMTVYKVFHAFLYESYSEALEAGISDFGLQDAASQIDIYFYGARNVARNIAISEHISLTWSTFLNDFVRNTFGLSFFAGNSTNLTIAKYNLYIYRGTAKAGYLYSSAAYGYQFFGFVLAPFAAGINLLISLLIERILNRIRYLDIYYILSIVYIRFIVSMFACFPLIWNYASRTLVIGVLIIGGASLLKKHTRSSRQTEEKEVALNP